MPLITIPATKLDYAVARMAARHTNPLIQNCARAATWAADGKVLGAIIAATWLLSRAGPPRRKALAGHLARTVAAAVILPKALKTVIDQERPDRSIVGRNRRGVKKSGQPQDSFPSGHSVHIGAVASAFAGAYPRHAPLIWLLGTTLSATRVVVLAHWTSDVLIGLSMGVAIERATRKHFRHPGDVA
jgi:membrane-associated phospholipid phosphatase